MFNKNTRAATYQANGTHGAETAEEVIGILTAISVVSKRMAKKLALLEQESARKEASKRYGNPKRVPRDAD